MSWRGAYEPGGEEAWPKGKRPISHDPSIEHEPHLADNEFPDDETEATAGLGMDPIGGGESFDDEVEHGVWDEPGISRDLTGPIPDDAATYAAWLAKGRQEVTAQKSWRICWLVVLLAGPWSVLATFITHFSGGFRGGIVVICVIGPIIEEIMKASAILWIVEKRPYFFTSRLQILICALASGFCFAVIENFLYLNVYIADPTPTIILVRWTACVALHVGCTLIAGWGLSRVWRRTMNSSTRPDIRKASPYLMAAATVHGLYNTSAVLLTAAVGGL